MTLVGVILAGGKSSRMGEDKALLPWRGAESLLMHQASTLAEIVGPDAVYVSGSRAGFKSIPDNKQNCGPLEGVKTSLEHLVRVHSAFQVAFIPVDMPLLTSSEIGDLISNIGPSDAAIFEGTNLPVFIRKPELALEKIKEMENLGSESGYSLQNLYTRLKMAAVRHERRASLMNLNTPEEYDVAISETKNPS